MAIKEIERSAAQKISSGQVVVDLSTAVKELLENALDAHATQVEIRFRASGLDGFQVIDDGHGIATADFEGIARKHHTSKLETFSDLEKVSTLGFRGEAMSSLCALTSVELVTSQANSGLATRIAFDHHGEIVSKKTTNGKKGTHVTVSDMFFNLPVRKKDLQKNIKREFAKAVALVQAYAAISTGVKIIVTDIRNSNLKSVVLTNSGTTVADNIISLFGAGSLDSLAPFTLNVKYKQARKPLLFREKVTKSSSKDNGSDEEPEGARRIDSDDYELEDNDEQLSQEEVRSVVVKGYVSQPIFGKGRTSSDRQFMFVNSRPSLLPKFTRAISGMYKQFNSVQVPFILADLSMDTSNYDVNVAPDKKTILIHDEEQIIESLKLAFSDFFDQFGHTVPTQEVHSTTGTMNLQKDQRLGDYTVKEQTASSIQTASRQKTVITETPTLKSLYEAVGLTRIQTRVQKKEHQEKISAETLEELDDDSAAFQSESQSTFDSAEEDVPEYGSSNIGLHEAVDVGPVEQIQKESNLNQSDSEDYVSDENLVEDRIGNSQSDKLKHHNSSSRGSLFVASPTSEMEDGQSDNDGHSACSHDHNKENEDVKEPQTAQSYAIPSTVRTHLPMSSSANHSVKSLRTVNKSVNCGLIFEEIRSKWDSMKALKTGTKSSPEDNGITTYNIPDEKAETAESRLNTIVKKSDFLNMNIIGQFNRGFILASRSKDGKSASDLFIIDQHASDEKFNFENYTKTMVLEQQPLFKPLQLNISVVEELAIQDNLDIIRRNGFGIKVDTSMPPGQKCSLTAFPLSKTTIFDINDLYELVSLIGERPGDKSVTCTKVRAMLAMRACRTSIMIGDTLKFDTMDTVVKHLATLDKPWNCPHGRPTLRHLTSVAKDKGFKEDLGYL